MSTEETEKKKAVGLSKSEYDVITNKIAVAIAKHEAVVQGWIAKSARANEPRKTQAELEAEDAALFRPQPPRLGLGCPIPAQFLKNDTENSTKELRAKFFPSKTLKASKARDAEEKAASAKRGLKEQSSDEEGGRSSLGRAKKLKTKPQKEEVKIELQEVKREPAIDESIVFKAPEVKKERAENGDPNGNDGTAALTPSTDSGRIHTELEDVSLLAKRKKKSKDQSPTEVLGIVKVDKDNVNAQTSANTPEVQPASADTSESVIKPTVNGTDEGESDIDEEEKVKRREAKKKEKLARKKERKEKRRMEGAAAGSP
ncbi:hypothetical protein GLAREA_03069 [Glarea lozoyensis ATCC 20868]|uniref:Uncharacterized protein n=1 Tax=Glarea lozoyensis (strain ATCC 20868 / MF5171) TaxID=1116229 RepID=S3CN55_GLAL2|nr:uncharacterized protein GLAREA_03069 [Glarea lozoyensis ATCC 20868]EPE27155.1 hypothetical protein GLAREA_03069 [Glarea lozoyensis ATCC 20868]